MCNLLGNVLVLIFTSSVLLCHGHTFEDIPSTEIALDESVSATEKLNVSEGVKFFIYTRNNPTQYEQFELDIMYYLQWTHFNPKRPVKILVHGWKCSYKSAYNVLLKNAYLTQYNVNVIIVDWRKYSILSYTEARKLVSDIAEVVAKLIRKLNEEIGINLDNIHIVGHSLGAHVAGIAGLKTQGKVGRITGLDPAGPLFSIADENRISKKSAKFVDIMHTDGGGAGFYHNLGHVDFYPNGGTPIQPGCGVDVLTLRSHRRAYWLFAESITTPDGFVAVKCNSWSDYKEFNCGVGLKTYMGEHVSPEARGTYYLRTNYETPFALETLHKTLRTL